MGKYWYQKQLRMLQTVFREPDIMHYDAVSVVDYLKKTSTNCIIVNAGGIVDFFENDTELGQKNPFMTTEDMLRDLTGECHDNGIVLWYGSISGELIRRGMSRSLTGLRRNRTAVRRWGGIRFTGPVITPTIPMNMRLSLFTG